MRLLSILFELVALNPYEPGYFSLKGAVLQSMGLPFTHLANQSPQVVPAILKG